MNSRFSFKAMNSLLAICLLFMAITASPAVAQWDRTNWGLVTSPVYGTSERVITLAPNYSPAPTNSSTNTSQELFRMGARFRRLELARKSG